MRIVRHPAPQIAIRYEHLGNQLIACFGDEYKPTHAIFDSNDYTHDHSVIDDFRDIAFTWTRDRPTDRVPSYFVEITRDPTCTHLVWLSRRALAYSDQIFVWVFAHELRHVYQARRRFPRDETRRAVQELRRKPRYAHLPSRLFAPEEIDCELFALRAVGTMYGTDEMHRHLTRNPLPRCPDPAYLELLQERSLALEL